MIYVAFHFIYRNLHNLIRIFNKHASLRTHTRETLKKIRIYNKLHERNKIFKIFKILFLFSFLGLFCKEKVNQNVT